VQDGTGAAAGNPFLGGTGWDVIFTPDLMASNLTRFEVYQISINGPVGSSLLVARNRKPWNYVAQGWANSWDPSQPLMLGGGDELEFWWTVAFTSGPYDHVSNIQPTVTLWLRQDQAGTGGA
jgi:hypothetical protein